MSIESEEDLQGLERAGKVVSETLCAKPIVLAAA
ncbi:MAG: hypothetical protein ACI8V2_000909 [Candidatus Latescibacterota bacterium]|jgi:hypothetical protein